MGAEPCMGGHQRWEGGRGGEGQGRGGNRGGDEVGADRVASWVAETEESSDLLGPSGWVPGDPQAMQWVSLAQGSCVGSGRGGVSCWVPPSHFLVIWGPGPGPAGLSPPLSGPISCLPSPTLAGSSLLPERQSATM